MNVNMLDKIKEVQKFIESNKDKDLTWCADNNGIVSRRTFFNWRKEGLLSANPSANPSASASASENTDRSMDTPTDKTDKTDTSEIIQNLFEEHEKNETRKLKNRQYNYNTRRRETLVEELQKENEELKSKYEELKSKYEQLQTDLIFERQLKEKYENQIHNLPYKQSEFNELKKKYENLQLDYFALKNGKESKDESNEKPKEQKSHWWEEI